MPAPRLCPVMMPTLKLSNDLGSDLDRHLDRNLSRDLISNVSSACVRLSSSNSIIKKMILATQYCLLAML
jgi:hypothetical protein